MRGLLVHLQVIHALVLHEMHTRFRLVRDGLLVGYEARYVSVTSCARMDPRAGFLWTDARADGSTAARTRMIGLENVTKVYSTHGVNVVRCSFPARTQFGIVTVHGVAKSTLLRVFWGADAPDAGTVRCRGRFSCRSDSPAGSAVRSPATRIAGAWPARTERILQESLDASEASAAA
jgi:hypothetical protein